MISRYQTNFNDLTNSEYERIKMKSADRLRKSREFLIESGLSKEQYIQEFKV